MRTGLARKDRATAWRTAPNSAGRWRQPRGGSEAHPSPAAKPKPAPRSLAAAPTTTPRARHDVDLGRLASIDLDTLAERGELHTRVDRKYLVDLAVVPELVAALWSRADGIAALEPG